MNIKMKITFYGGVGFVTGANFLCETEKVKFLVDCGLFQGSREADEENYKPFPYNPATVDFLFVTHAHMDHIGRIPKLVRDGFRGIIYSNPVTKSIAELMFADALSIMTMEAQNKDAPVLYEEKDIKKALSLWETFEYHQKKEFGDDFSVIGKNAGHILGSTMYEFKIGSKKIVFTGDLGNSPTPLLPDTEIISDADYLIMESVYGNKNHEPKDERDKKFESILRETINKRKTLLIPAFSLERTQVILYEINKLVESGKIPPVPVFLDSPLAIKVTKIYESVSSHFKDDVRKEISKGDDIFNFPKLKSTARADESQNIMKTSNPKVIIAGSGMSSGGRVISHEMHFLPDPKATVLLIGYQSVGTLGRRIEERNKEVMIKGVLVPVRASVEKIEGYSSHKDSDGLVGFVEDTEKTVKKVFVVMGEPKAGTFLTQRLRDELGVDAVYPEKGQSYELSL